MVTVVIMSNVYCQCNHLSWLQFDLPSNSWVIRCYLSILPFRTHLCWKEPMQGPLIPSTIFSCFICTLSRCFNNPAINEYHSPIPWSIRLTPKHVINTKIPPSPGFISRHVCVNVSISCY